MKKTILFLGVLFLAGCCCPHRCKQEVKFYSSLEAIPPELSFTLPVGKSTAVASLFANPTTGYDWAAQCDPAACKVKLDFVAPDTTMCGAPGKTQVVVTPLKAGESVVTLAYRRHWEKGVPPIRTVKLRIHGAGVR